MRDDSRPLPWDHHHSAATEWEQLRLYEMSRAAGHARRATALIT
jgi:hypothetical protein